MAYVQYKYDQVRIGSAQGSGQSLKHEVSFDKARSVFHDEFAVQFFDEEHSSDKERFLVLSMISGAKLLLVCHYKREHGEVIRIISARTATQRESAFYLGG